MKKCEMPPFRIGGRICKTVIAVFLCFLIDTFRNTGVPFYAAIAAILCVQRSQRDSLRAAKNREIATIIGGICGMLFILAERNLFHIQTELLRYAVLSVLLIPIIELSLYLRQEKGTFLMCVVFLCVTTTHENDISPVAFAMNRIIDTTIGIMVALIVNVFPYGKKKERKGMSTFKEFNLKLNGKNSRESARPVHPDNSFPNHTSTPKQE